jgi:murein L,D-transpeptidase YcbB/YkuD
LGTRSYNLHHNNSLFKKRRGSVVRKMLVVLLSLGLAGCATTQSQQLTNQLQTRVGDLERQVDQKDEEIKGLKEEVKDLSYGIDRLNAQAKRGSSGYARSSGSKGSSMKEEDIIRVGVSAEKVQRALQKAGYYEGAIDGKVGAKTRTAISNFQRDHGLTADGIIGAKTWSELKGTQAPRRHAAATSSAAESTTATEATTTDSSAAE